MHKQYELLRHCVIVSTNQSCLPFKPRFFPYLTTKAPAFSWVNFRIPNCHQLWTLPKTRSKIRPSWARSSRLRKQWICVSKKETVCKGISDKQVYLKRTRDSIVGYLKECKIQFCVTSQIYALLSCEISALRELHFFFLAIGILEHTYHMQQTNLLYVYAYNKHTRGITAFFEIVQNK